MIFDIKSQEEFESVALKTFRQQYEDVDVYRRYCDLIHVQPDLVLTVNDIPFLPISFFKSQVVASKDKEVVKVFYSSGTGDINVRSKHYVADLDIYSSSLLKSFVQFVGNPAEFMFYSMLPGYEENPNSSLIFMINALSKRSLDKQLHQFPSDFKKLAELLEITNEKKIQNILFGVSHALLDFSEKFKTELPYTTIIETGGMKGRRKEITSMEMHSVLKERLNPGRIISEYGMTELLSQAYSTGNELFHCPPWMKVLVRDLHDPFLLKEHGSGAINIIDLANIYSCSFIATDDLGNIKKEGGFELLGRFDHSDIRGCNLLYEGRN